MKVRFSMAARSGVLLVAAILCACAPSRSVRVEPIEQEPAAGSSTSQSTPAAASGAYTVVRGDTLFGIAFRHSLDYRDLAKLNRIAAPYTIYPGQRLQLGDRAIAAESRPEPARPRGATRRSTGSGLIAGTERPASASAGQSASSAASAKPSSGGAAAVNNGAAGANTATAKPMTPATIAAPAPAVAPIAVAAPLTPAALPKGPVRWQWPADGALVSTFVAGDPTRQGIGIGGSNGQRVVAAGAGTVVYSGAGLIGYGELIIIKHSDEWLSAYGHNRKRLVAEGEAVQAGQQVAEMGRSGASRDMLHFEIRRNGKPVDPRGLLPKR